MNFLFEQKVIQNTGLAAEAIWQATNEAYTAKGKTEGVAFPLVFLVLPLTFHQRTATALAKKQQSGAIFKAIAEDREITVGLQARMEALSDRTMEALSVGFHTGMLVLDQGHSRQILPGRKSAPVSHVTEEVKTIIAAAKRVGFAFSEMTTEQLSNHLNIRF